MSVEINCSECGAESFLSREAVYEGFSKVGETLSCASCGFVYASEAAVPFKKKEAAPVIFTDADRTKAVKVFDESENKQLCRYCAAYVVNPFMQFCATRKKEVQATDSCPQFSEASSAGDEAPPLF